MYAVIQMMTRTTILLLGLSLFGLLATGCRKNSDIVDVDIDAPDPGEVLQGSIAGRVTDADGNALANAIVELYQDGLLIDQQECDVSGSYSFPDLQISNPRVMMRMVHPDHIPDVRDVENGVDRFWDMTLRMVPESMMAEQPHLHVQESDLVHLHGTILDENDQPAPGIALIYENGLLIDYAVTDPAGQYKLTRHTNTIGELILLDNCGMPLHNQIVPALHQSHQFAPVSFPIATTKFLHGDARTCGGNPLSNGYALAHLEGGTVGILPLHTDGFFIRYFGECLTPTTSGRVVAVDESTSTTSSLHNFTPQGGDVFDIGELVTCESSTGQLDFSLNGQSAAWPVAFAATFIDDVIDPNTGSPSAAPVTRILAARDHGSSYWIMDVVGISPGATFIRSIKFVQNGQTRFKVQPDQYAALDLQVEISQHDQMIDGLVSGTITGQLTDPATGMVFTIDGPFSAQLF